MPQTEHVPSTELHEAVPSDIANAWIGAFGNALASNDIGSLVELVASDGWWRDVLAFTWDLRAFHGGDRIADELGPRIAAAKVADVRPMEDWDVESRPAGFSVPRSIVAAFTFSTSYADCRGICHLVEEAGSWRARTVLTDMVALRDCEWKETWPEEARRGDPSTTVLGRKTHAAQRREMVDFVDRDPDVVIIGGGHCGLIVAARLEHLGISALVVDKSERVGDSWRKRYASLVLHSPKYADAFPYLPYPENWPLFPATDQVANWLEIYATALEIRVWSNSTVDTATYDEQDGSWTVGITRAGEPRELRPRHVVFATGVAGKPIIPAVDGLETFPGIAMHSDEYEGGSDAIEGKKVLVVGSSSSGADIAQDAYEMGADEVTMLQRGDTYVTSIVNGHPFLFGSFAQYGYEKGDFMNLSTSFGQAMDGPAQAVTEAIAEADKPLLDGLVRAGFGLSNGERGAGLLPTALNRAGGYYVDKGCLQLIADGDVRIVRGSISGIDGHEVHISDGNTVESDVIVFATGYEGIKDVMRPILGDAVLERVGPIWGLDEEGEIRGTWGRPTGVPRLWCFASGLNEARPYSRYLALQIAADLHGLRD